MNRSFVGAGSRRVAFIGVTLLAAVVGSSLIGCDGSNDSADNTPPPAAIPPLAASAVNIDDGHMVGSRHWPDGDTSDGAQGQSVAGLECGAMVETYHVHSHLSVFLNGQALALPASIGIVDTSPSNGCFYNLHTHDLSGKIHVEAPAPGTFTLGQFFRVWGQPLERDNVAGLLGLPVVVYLADGGAVSEYTGDLAAIVLRSHRLITIQVGTPITEIPNFDWSAN